MRNWLIELVAFILFYLFCNHIVIICIILHLYLYFWVAFVIYTFITVIKLIGLREVSYFIDMMFQCMVFILHFLHFKFPYISPSVALRLHLFSITLFQLFVDSIWCLHRVKYENPRLHVFYGCTVLSNGNMLDLTRYIWHVKKSWDLTKTLNK